MSRNNGEPGRKILVVEDEKIVRDYVISVLAQNGHEVMAAESAEQAVAVFLEHGEGIGLVFSDINLPGRTGVDLMNDIRKHRQDMPFVICSADTHFLQHEDVSRYTFLAKPCSADSLLKTVQREMNMPGA